MSNFVKIGTKSEFKENVTTEAKVGEKSICVTNVGGQLTAFDNSCTHAEAQLSGCDIEDGQVACPLHGARFDVKTGAAITPPAVRPVRMHGIKVEGDDVLVRLTSDE